MTDAAPTEATAAPEPAPQPESFSHRFADTLQVLRHPELRGSSQRTEFLAGLTTFVTMAYIIFVNTDIMFANGTTGLNRTALTLGTIFAAIVPTLFMGLWADLPWALAPGLGYNALFAYTVVGANHIPTGAALALVFLDGLAFLLLVIGPWRDALIRGIPLSLKLAAGAGIGLFIAFIGMVNANMIKILVGAPLAPGQVVPSNGSNTWLLELSPLNDPAVLVAIAGLLITAALLAYRVRAALLIGIVITAIIAWATALIDPATRASLLPFNAANPHGLGDFIAWPDVVTFWNKKGTPDFAALIGGGHGASTIATITAGAILLFFLTFLVTDMMDSFGTFSGLATKLGILTPEGGFPGSGRALIVDAAAGMWGPLTGNATIATFIESAAGESEGGRTGLTAVWVAVFFVLALFFVPLIGLVPGVATAPVLIIVGYFMIEPVLKIAFQDVTEGLPAFLTLLVMPVTYSIADGMFAGIATYVILKVIRGRIAEISWVMWLFAALLLLAKVLQAIHA